MINLTFVAAHAVTQAAIASLLNSAAPDPSPSRRPGGQPIILDYEALKLAAATGVTLKQAAAAAGLSYATAKRRLIDDARFAEIWAERPTTIRSQKPPIHGDRIRALAAAGLNKVSAAAEIGISPYVFGWGLRRDPKLRQAWNEGAAAFLLRPVEKSPPVAGPTIEAEPKADGFVAAKARRRPGPAKTKPMQSAHGVRELDPVAVRALAAAGMGKGRAAAAMGFSGYSFAKLLAESSVMAQAWHYGKMDRWRRNPRPTARPRLH